MSDAPHSIFPWSQTGLETSLFLLRDTVMVLRYLANVHIYLINIPADGVNHPLSSSVLNKLKDFQTIDKVGFMGFKLEDFNK